MVALFWIVQSKAKRAACTEKKAHIALDMGSVNINRVIRTGHSLASTGKPW